MPHPLHSIHIGVNRGWWSRDNDLYDLLGAENDARAMAQLASEIGVSKPEVFVGTDASVNSVTVALRAAIDAASPDGVLLVTYAGHGLDLPGGGVIDEEIDQSFVLYDGLLCDDCFGEILATAGPEVTVVCVFDSCSAAGLVRLLPEEIDLSVDTRPRYLELDALEPDQQQLVDASCQACAPQEIKAKTIALAACERRKVALERNGKGVFTVALLDCWRNGFAGSYAELVADAGSRMETQKPVLRVLGQGAALARQPALRF